MSFLVISKCVFSVLATSLKEHTLSANSYFNFDTTIITTIERGNFFTTGYYL